MKVSSLLRVSIVGAALGAAFSAQAVTILLISSGTGTNAGPIFTQTESVVVQSGGLGALSNLVLNTNIGTLLGSGTYTGASGSLSFSYVVTNPVTFNGVAQSYSAAWTLTGGTGAYAGYTGSGTLASSILASGITPLPTGTVFVGDLQAVPEPASMAALAIGGLGLMRRRNKKA